MTRKISRRDFIKTAGIGAAATAVLTGCGPASKYVVREPYIQMPEYTYNGQSTYYATSCGECPAGCGTIVRTMQGRALKIEGNPNHPVSLGKTCARGQIALQGLYNPDRYEFPATRSQRGSESMTQISWDDGISLVTSTFTKYQPGEIAFLFGLTSDHLFDLATEITHALGSPAPLRYSAFETFEGRATLAKATQQTTGIAAIPFFDLAYADVTFSFGANFLSTYLSPVAYGREFAYMRQGRNGKRGYLVQFEQRISQTGVVADEWIPIAPGTEGLVALAFGRLIAELKGGTIPAAYQNVDLTAIENASGVSNNDMHRLAELFANAEHALAIPGGSALTASNGLDAGVAIMALNNYVDNLGKPGGIFLTPPLPVHADNPSIPNTIGDIQNLIIQMNSGAIKALFIHGVNPVFELPPSSGFLSALSKVATVVSFASFPDETSLQADAVLPAHTPLESWGYQKVVTGTDRPVISGFQPVVSPLYDTKSPADVLLAAVQSIGGDLATAVPYTDEVDFLQQSLQGLIGSPGFFSTDDMRTFWPFWQQNGGWWNESAGLASPFGAPVLSSVINPTPPEFDGDGDFYLMPFFSTLLSDGSGANKPWLQEIPDPTTTVVWSTWVELNPDTADKLGIEDDDILKVTSPYGELEAVVIRYPPIRPDTIGIAFGQGHSAYGRYAQNRGANVAALLGTRTNSASDLAVYSVKVKIEKTGKRLTLPRFEGNPGQYGIP
jgi:anaerobic selenocysteine-containing dehydrogenase